MIEHIDKRIAALESELADLKRQKLAILQAQVAAIQASLAGGAVTVTAPKNKGGRPRKNPLPFAVAAAVPAPKNKPGRPRKNPLPVAAAPDPAKTKSSDEGGWPAEILALGSSSKARKKPASTAKADKPGWPAEILALGSSPKVRKKRGRKPGKHVPDEQILPSITKLVTAAGKEGISGRRVAQAVGVFYPRVTKLMDQHFRKAGERKWSRYFAK